MSPRLLLSAAGIVLTMGLVLVSVTDGRTLYAAEGTPSPTVSGTVAATATPGSPSPSASVSVSPSASPAGTPRQTIKLWQRTWSEPGNKKVAAIDSLPGKSGDFEPCSIKTDESESNVRWDKYLRENNIDFQNKDGVFATKGGTSHLISTVFTAADKSRVDWRTLEIAHRNGEAFDVYYRTSNKGGTSKANDKDWKKLNPSSKDSRSCKDGWELSQYSVNKNSTYFQYKIVVRMAAFRFIPVNSPQIGMINVTARSDSFANDPGRPSPTPSATPSTGVSPSPVPGTGRVTIETKVLAATTKATPSPTTALLPTPSTAPTTSPASTQPNPACFSNQDTEPAANVPFRLRQLEGGEVNIEDQRTDETGRWRGLNGKQDTFGAGTYLLNWGDFQKEEYKLVDICFTPNDGSVVRRSETSISGNQRATFIIKDGQETRITLLYAKRENPYVSMNKIAINSKNKLLRLVYPGSQFRYVIRYENTGEADAYDVVIRDLIPEQFYVVGSESQTVDSLKDMTVERDANGRTLISKKLGTLRRNQKGSIIIPVVLRPNAFGSPEDISNGLNSSSPASAGSPASSSDDDLELQ